MYSNIGIYLFWATKIVLSKQTAYITICNTHNILYVMVYLDVYFFVDSLILNLCIWYTEGGHLESSKDTT